MAIKNLVVIFAAISLLAAATPLLAQDGPPPLGGEGSIPADAQIDAWVKYWIDRIITADTDRQIIEARQSLVSGYDRFTDAGFRYTYAELAASRMTPMFNALSQIEEDELRAVREINGAMAVAMMDQVSAQLTLQTMVSHPNAGVRYWGWRGLANIRELSLAQGPNTAQGLFAALQQQGAAETSAIVFGVMFETLTLPVSPPATVSSAIWDQAIDAFGGVLSAGWADWCDQVSTADPSWVNVSAEAVDAMSRLGHFQSNDAPALKQTLHHLLHMMYAAYHAYYQAEPDSDPQRYSIVLLLGCEGSLRRHMPLPDNADIVEDALTDSSIRNHRTRLANVGQAVLTWKDHLVNDSGVVAPPIPLFPEEEPDDEEEDGS